MAHFAELDSDNKVIRVLVVRNQDITDSNNVQQEALGITFLQNLFGGNWKQTSYNTWGNVHYDANGNPDGGVAFRGNFAGTGCIYDPVHDVFYAPQPYPSWTIGPETNWLWKAPVPRPEVTPKQKNVWNEETKSWDIVDVIK